MESDNTPTITPEERATLYVSNHGDSAVRREYGMNYRSYLAGWNDRAEEVNDLRLEKAKLELELSKYKFQATLDENKNLIQ